MGKSGVRYRFYPKGRWFRVYDWEQREWVSDSLTKDDAIREIYRLNGWGVPKIRY